MYNPDYPTDNTLGFAQHTYQPQQSALNYWDGGMGMGTYMNPYNNMDSRRNMGMAPVSPMNPVNPFNQFGPSQNQQNAIPESQVQPFSTYPPQTPMANAAGGLNGMLVDSRRNTPQQPMTTNPWATAQQNQMAQQSAMNMQQNPYMNPYANPYMGSLYSGNVDYPYVDMNTSALYGNLGNNMGFDKKGIWDNYYTQSRALPMPVIDWRQQNQQNNYQNPYQYQQQNAMPQLSMKSIGTNNQNWKDIAEQNWANSSI